MQYSGKKKSGEASRCSVVNAGGQDGVRGPGQERDRFRSPTGRGTSLNPPNRFEKISRGAVLEDLAGYFQDPEPDRNVLTRFYLDHSRTILARNNSPDVGFTYSLNPYRGCEHGCIYCYARPTHEYLGFSSGIDFETKIMVKPDADILLAQHFNRPSWSPQVVMFSGDTDCYQPIERTLGITRRCLEVFLRFRNPVSVVTKNALIQRDVDILKELAALNLIAVTISLTSLDPKLIRHMEPRSASPAKRLETIEVLAHAGVPVAVNACPIIPALNDEEIPSILREAANRGARFAGYTVVRLPHAVKDLFLEWLRRELPERAPAIVNRIRSVRNGELSCSDFGTRMNGEGRVAESIEQLFQAACRTSHLNQSKVHLSTSEFLSPRRSQMEMF